ncbi:hypothetical protein [Nocardia sp. CA-119907]|uniref:hypothetical protein n=1 Tax=Nocardia sp. CA-119907 TaxID=3239973 RepID=UPI003D957FAB
MGVPVGRPLAVRTFGRPKSSLAQIVTAVAAVAVLAVALLVLDAERSTQDTNAAQPVSDNAAVEALCLDYARYVIDEYRAGLTVDQINATLTQAGRISGAIPGPQYDVLTACGSASTVLHTAGLK